MPIEEIRRGAPFGGKILRDALRRAHTRVAGGRDVRAVESGSDVIVTRSGRTPSRRLDYVALIDAYLPDPETANQYAYEFHRIVKADRFIDGWQDEGAHDAQRNHETRGYARNLCWTNPMPVPVGTPVLMMEFAVATLEGGTECWFYFPAPSMVREGRISAYALSTVNRWLYTMKPQILDMTGDWIDDPNADSFPAQNRAERHNDGEGQESNGVGVGTSAVATVELLPIMIDSRHACTAVAKSDGAFDYWFSAGNDVQVGCNEGRAASGGANGQAFIDKCKRCGG